MAEVKEIPLISSGSITLTNGTIVPNEAMFAYQSGRPELLVILSNSVKSGERVLSKDELVGLIALFQSTFFQYREYKDKYDAIMEHQEAVRRCSADIQETMKELESVFKDEETKG